MIATQDLTNNLARLSQEEKSRVVLVFYPLTMTASLTPIGQMGLSAHSDWNKWFYN